MSILQYDYVYKQYLDDVNPVNRILLLEAEAMKIPLPKTLDKII